jgi:hypothetical protein
MMFYLYVAAPLLIGALGLGVPLLVSALRSPRNWGDPAWESAQVIKVLIGGLLVILVLFVVVGLAIEIY